MRRGRGRLFLAWTAGATATMAIASCGQLERSAPTPEPGAPIPNGGMPSGDAGASFIEGGALDCPSAKRCRAFCFVSQKCGPPWGCCYQGCWSECLDGSAGDGSASHAGTLCSPCRWNDDCEPGAACLQHGALTPGQQDDASVSRCGRNCAADGGCPVGYTCLEIDYSIYPQCVPTSGVCE